jgi:predicted transcriptional regulator
MSDTQSLAPLETPQACEPPPNKGVRHLTIAQLGRVLELNAEGHSQAKIGQMLGCSQQTISDALRRLGGDTTRLATHHAKAKAYAAARRLARITAEGKDEHAIKAAGKLLEVAGVTDNGKSKQDIGIQVIVGMPGKPAGPDPFGDADVVIEAKVIARDSEHNTQV